MRLPHCLLPAALAALFGLNAGQALAQGGARVEVGKPAPDFTLEAANVRQALPHHKGDTLSLKDVRGKNVVLYFFPKAMTPGCTVQSCGFRDLTREFAKLDTVVVGISTDHLNAQEQFTRKEGLNFPLVADPDKKIAREYGVLSPERGLAQRTTFVIDKKGVVRKIYRNVNAQKNPDEVLRYVKENLASREWSPAR
jgi:peroxiredoxin Q/BCP